jgi:hypothetical protein
MMIYSGSQNGLKGQYNLAQGNPPVGGDALGLRKDIKIVRAITFNREDFFIRTKGTFRFFRSIKQHYSVRKRFFALFTRITRTVFYVSFSPGVAWG